MPPMKDEPALPPMPEPADTIEVADPIGGRGVIQAGAFTADQLHAYALAERAAERERCAKICEAGRTKGWELEPEEVERGFNAALRMAAAAIRSQK